MKFDRSALLALAGAAVFACACGPNDNSRANSAPNPSATGTAGAAASSGPTASAADKTDATKPSVVLTGCLQQEKGILGDYILSQARQEPATGAAVGTSGEATGTANAATKAGGGSVEQRQLAQAERSYRLSGESEQLKDNIGHEVRVRGSLTDTGDVAKSGDNDLKQSDLAKVDVESVELVGN